jgi:hypothetical protein
MNHAPLWALLWTAAALPGVAQAQSLWRCDSGSRVVYQGEPCAGGRAVEALAPRTPADEAEARRVASRDRALAERLGTERRARERLAAAPAAGILHSKTELSPTKKPQPQPKPKHPQPLDAGVDTGPATRPSSR